MYTISGSTITLTRGDTLIVNVDITRNGEEYTPAEGDVIRFALKKSVQNVPASRSAAPLLTKIIPNETMILRLDPEDTSELLFGSYVYDIELTFADGTVDTFIADAQFDLTVEVE